MDGAVKLLKELLTIRSVNGRDDEGAVAEYLCKYFEQSGISAHIQRIDATHANVLAELEGESDGAPIFWNGHLDTVPYGDTGEWKTDPAVPVERDGFLYARGASDMKSGLAAMVYALCEYKKSGRPVPRTIHFLGTCDEEKGGIVDWNFLHKYCVGFDSESMPEDAKLNENFKDYVLGAYDNTPKTPEWASLICGTPTEDITWFAEKLGKKRYVDAQLCSGSLQRLDRSQSDDDDDHLHGRSYGTSGQCMREFLQHRVGEWRPAFGYLGQCELGLVDSKSSARSLYLQTGNLEVHPRRQVHLSWCL